MRLKVIALSIIGLSIFTGSKALADEALARRLAGRILLQVESRGEAWYVNPSNLNRYYLAGSSTAFDLIKTLSIGISNQNLRRIPIGLLASSEADRDGDGLPERLEKALGTDPQKSDSDGDSFADNLEIANNYDPAGVGVLPIDKIFASRQSGKFFLQVESAGELWYLNPSDRKRYYVGGSSDVYLIIKKLGLGITNALLQGIAPSALSLAQINQTPPVNQPPTVSPTTTPPTTDGSADTAGKALSLTAEKIRANNLTGALDYFTPEIRERVKYSLNSFDTDSKLAFANLLTAAKEANGTADEKKFSSEVYFDLGGYKINLKFVIKKQVDGYWLIANL